ncbi:hypothetical protein ABKV19_025150 [Rosa sericea]
MASLTNEAAASSSSSSLPRSSTDHQNHYTCQVFLSFRGEDTRSNFTDHLYTALFDRGIQTFRDADKLRRGEEISVALLKAIEESRVSIIVFSQNYASSRWCLDELVKILDCRKSKGQEVIPVFYKVDPSHVRHQTGAFADAIATLDQCKYKDRVGKWREALSDAANLSGWTYEEDQSEAEFIKKIVGDLSARVVNPSYDLDVAKHQIGLESCRKEVNSLLKVEENIVRMVGIWGTGGIGKTTIAKAVFNSIRHKFECCCFLTDVRSKDLAQLQETLLSDILNSTLKLSSVDQGVSFIKTMMRHKKILLILDDVSDSSQLEKLVPFPSCFGLGSRILITTRDKRCLTAYPVNEVYEAKILDDGQALELFSLNAFKSNGPPHTYLELARHAVRYAQGLPLALIVLGSHLFNRSIEEWKATIGSCKGGPQADIQKVLKLSYDALEKDLQELFLDIACFFKGRHATHVKSILEACYDRKTMMIGIAQFQEKALIRIDKTWMGDTIWMHDLIEEMGKDIVFQESPDEPEERSRVWSAEDVNDVLTNNKGTNKVISIQAPWGLSSISLNAKSFSEMKKLRYISMSKMKNYESIFGDIDYHFDQLRWLDWRACPLQCFPSNFQANKLVNLDISGSRKITRLWEGRKNFLRLTCMDLRGCESLKELPDLSGIPNLKELHLSECISLVEVPDSIRFLHNLVTLNLSGCKSLKELSYLSGIPNLKELDLSRCTGLVEVPDSIRFLHNLVTLNLRGYESLKELPDLSGIPNLKELDLSMWTGLVEVPDSIRFLHNLVTLDLSGCESLKELPDLSGIPNLKELDLSECTGLVEVPDSIRFLHNLVTLNLSGCESLKELPDLSGIPNLKRLALSECTGLVEVPDSIRFLHLVTLNLRGCKSLKELPDLSGIPNLKGLYLSECTGLVEVPDSIRFLHNLVTLDLSGCGSLKELPDLSGIPNLKELDLSECTGLVEVPDSIRFLHNLVTLNLSGCESLKELPDLSGIPNLKELCLAPVFILGPNKLDLSECTGLVEVPDSIRFLHNLVTLNLSGCESLKELPDLSGIPNLKRLDLSECTGLVEVPDSIRFLHNLDSLQASTCTKLAAFPKIPIKMDSLRELSLSSSDIRELDESIENLIGLEHLDLTYCKNLTTLPCSIYGLHNLKTLCAGGCSKLTTFPKIPVKMDSLRRLYLGGSDIRELDESIENLIELEYLDLTECKNLTTLPCSIYGLQNLKVLHLGECSKLVRFPTNTKILNVDGCSLSLPKLQYLNIAGCSLLSDCDFLMTLDCWETLRRLDLSRNNFVSLPACLTKFVKLFWLNLSGCTRLREIPELPPNVILYTSGCESLEERFSTLTNRGAVIEAASPSIEEPTPSSWRLSLSSETPKRHRSAEEPSPAELSWLSLSTEPTPVNPPKRQRTAAEWQASTVHFEYELTISPIPMFPDLHSAHHSTTTPQLQHQKEPNELLRLSLSSEPTKPRGPVKGDQDQWLSLSVLPTLPSTSEL